MTPFFQAILAAALISLISLVGVLFLGLGDKKRQKLLFGMISFSAGSLMGGAFFHLIPESLENLESLRVFKLVIWGFLIFFILERIFLWHHCHNEHCDCQNRKILGYQNLIGDAMHNFLDGLIIVSAFLINPALGIPVAISVAFHEIPQEIGDFGVLIYSGFSKFQALKWNLISAVFAVLGVVAGYFAIAQIEPWVQFLAPVAAGGFIYIAASDLVPELHEEKDWKKSFWAILFFLLAIWLMLALRG